MFNTRTHHATRTLDLGRFAGPIFAIILLVDSLFFSFLEWWMPEHDLDQVMVHWDHSRFSQVGVVGNVRNSLANRIFLAHSLFILLRRSCDFLDNRWTHYFCLMIPSVANSPPTIIHRRR